jgi:NADPH-dependent glutamate synthase beta subunit-like oxidoreductase
VSEALDYLIASTGRPRRRRAAFDDGALNAAGKDVVVIGGGTRDGLRAHAVRQARRVRHLPLPRTR